MPKDLIVRPDKNEFLLYSMLNALRLINHFSPYDHFIKLKAYENFKGYQGIGLKQADYLHHSKPVAYVLTINEAPDFSPKPEERLDGIIKSDVEKGSAVLPHLKHFYGNTNFEEFYGSMLPRWEEECELVSAIVHDKNLPEVLDAAWETNGSFRMEIIPMPLERRASGIGPSIGETAYQIVGPPFGRDMLHLMGHEGSHPRAKVFLGPIRGKIEEKSRLMAKPKAHPNFYIHYDNWRTMFEEHFIRAMQLGWIDPFIGVETKPEYALKREEDKGFVYIRDFYGEIRAHKEKPEGTMADLALRILDRLDKKY